MSDSTTRAMPPLPPIEVALSLVVIEGPDAGASTDVRSPRTVGSSEHCDLRLSDPTVSRRHLTASPSDSGVRIVDQGSRNGTWVGDVRVEVLELAPGGRLRVGETVLMLEQSVGAPAASDPSSLVEPMRSFGRFLGSSEALQPLYQGLKRVADSDATVLLEGESGAGKELLAEAIHERGKRCHGPFVVVDCGSLPATLIESELLGHERGAFTGADGAHMGAFERAHGGTIFLDEIGELPLAMQTRLLRVLDRGQVQRVGGSSMIEVDVRVVAATHRNVEREVEQGRFRLDLFHRLAVVLLRVPPLRARKDDIVRLAHHFAHTFGAGDAITPEERERLLRHSWPGNVRELRNHVERLVLLGEAADFVHSDSATSPSNDLARSGKPYRQARAMALEEFSRAYTEDMLQRHGGNVSEAARAAGIARRYFQRLKSE